MVPTQKVESSVAQNKMLGHFTARRRRRGAALGAGLEVGLGATGSGPAGSCSPPDVGWLFIPATYQSEPSTATTLLMAAGF